MNLYQPTISGSLVVSGSVSVIGPFTMSGGSITGTASFASNSGLLSNLDSGSFVGTGSYNTLSSSFTTVSSSYSAASGSFSTRVSTLETASGSFSGRVTKIEGNYATTGSNIFTGAQTVCANITSTGTIIAQTLNVQQVTSSVVYSSGSNVFGCSLTNTQQFTGSVTMTGSLNVAGNTCVVSICSPSIIGGTMSGTTIYGSTAICGGVVCGTSATFTNTSGVTLTLQKGSGASIELQKTNATAQTWQIAGEDPNFKIYDTTASTTPFQITKSTGAATFSGKLTISNTSDAYGELTTSAIDADSLLGFSNTGDGNSSWGIGRRNTGEFWIANYTCNFLNGTRTIPFQIASNGTATFNGNTTSPIASFINTNTAGTGNGVLIQVDSQLGTDNYVLNAISNGTSRLYVREDGNVGIGTTAPLSRLDINGGCIRMGEYLNSASSLIGKQRCSTGTFYSSIEFYSTTGEDAIIFNTHLSGVSAGERMRITGGGDLKFNNQSTDPQYIYGGSNSGYMLIGGGAGTSLSCGANIILVGADRTGTNARGEITLQAGGTGAGSIIGFNTCGTERMRVTSEGYLAIGITCSSTTGVATVISNGGNIANQRLFGTGTQVFTQFYLGGTQIGSICGSGSTTSYNTTSDYRLKTDLKNYNGLRLINCLKTYDFAWKINNERSYGFLAHEIQEVIPYIVSGEKDGEEMQSLDYSKLTPILVKAIQEQQCTIDLLKTCLGIA